MPTAPAMPDNAQGMRKMWKEHAGEKYYPQLETTVPVPFDRVAQQVKAKARECLDVTVNKSARERNVTTHWQDVFTPTMTINGKKAELFVVENMGGAFDQQPQRFPIITADFAPASANSTKVVIYHLSFDPSLRTAHAIASWAAGQNAGCPDMGG